MTVVWKIIAAVLSLQNLVLSQTRSCPGLLGLSTGAVQDWQIAASSTHHTADSYGCSTKWARLYMPGSKAWCARHRSQNEWILVDLGVPAIVSGIMMQGRGEVPEWTSSFSLAYSVDAFRWNHVTDLSNNKKVYRGNNDSYSTRFIAIDPPIEARFIRLHILTWEGRPALKLELVGCQECNNIISEPPFTKMAASSVAAFSKRPNCAPENAYFNSFAGWCPKKSNPNQWLQIDLGPPKMVTAISTKGRWDVRRRQWVTRYTVTYSNDSILWFTYKDGNHLDAKIFGGNMDMITERTHYLNSPFIARYIRIHPATWHHGIGLRAAVVGCPRKGECGAGFLKLNAASGCLENLAYGRNTWVNDKRQGWRDWQTGRAALAVDGIESDVLSSCAILDNYYVDHPVWMVDLKKKKTIQGVYLVNWQGKGQDKITSYRDYVHNLEKLTIYVSNKPKLDSASVLSEAKCATISRHSGVLFNPLVHVECGDFLKGRYLYIRAVGVPHRRSRLFFAVLCEVMVY